MKSLSGIFKLLRDKNKSKYYLLFSCLMFSTLLMTAYCMMMYSPTVLNTLPEGGDSRKQVMMVFVLSVIGCGAFVMYAAGLFLRYKSKETGVFLALGASRDMLRRQLFKEVLGLSGTACISGMVLGAPLSWLTWWIFRRVLVDTPELTLIFDLRAYVIPAAFTVLILVMLNIMLCRFLGRVDILDIITESHRAEPIRKVPDWFGSAGILLVIAGAALGYFTPSFCVKVLHWYAPEGLTALCYIPAFIGLYMLLLHTVVHGWARGKNRYAHIIPTSMMQFQGRQTVRNMLVVTVLIAGAYFAVFYVPMIVAPFQLGLKNRTEDYSFFYRADQEMPSKAEIETLAKEYGVSVNGYVSQPSATLAVDGCEQVEKEGPLGVTYTNEYQEKHVSGRFFPVSAWNGLTGDNFTLAPGTVTTVSDSEGAGAYWAPNDVTLVTNPVTGRELNVKSVESSLKNELLLGCRIMNDADFDLVTEGLPEEWKEEQVFFNVSNDNYGFAKALFYRIVECSEAETAICDGYDRIVRDRYLERGEEYYFDDAEKFGIPIIRLDQPDSSVFRLNWMYMPKFRVLEHADFLATMAVFLLLFVFIAVLCFSAVSVILFTRSMTLAMTNAWVYDDLRKLGASEAYLYKTAKEQTKRVFRAPVITGTLLILVFYLLILWGNDGGVMAYELAGFGGCLAIIAALSMLIMVLYRFTVRQSCKLLRIKCSVTRSN